MKLHFIGIKGSGMSSLALIANSLGYDVSGSDVDNFIFTQEALTDKGIPFYSFDKNNIKNNISVVIGNSFDERNIEVVEAKKNPTVKVYRYYDFLSELMSKYISIGVAGSHGKTTTTGMLTSLLKPIRKTGYLIGDGTGYLSKESEVFIVEADEYKDTFLHYQPNYSIITNIDLDHTDYFKTMDQYIGSFQTFVNQTSDGLVLCGDDEFVRTLDTSNKSILYYGMNDRNDVRAVNLIEENHVSVFNLIVENQDWGKVTLDFVGRHNLLNMLASVATAHLMGVSKENILKHINDFKGQHRRFIVEDFGDYVYIDDYAHHPTEIKVTIEAARTRYPHKRLVLVYKPDRLSRAQYFEKDFRDVMNLADKSYMTHFYSGARMVEDLDYDIFDFQKSLDDVEIITEDKEGAVILSKEGPAVYLFVSTKDVYLFKDLLKEYQL